MSDDSTSSDSSCSSSSDDSTSGCNSSSPDTASGGSSFDYGSSFSGASFDYGSSTGNTPDTEHTDRSLPIVLGIITPLLPLLLLIVPIIFLRQQRHAALRLYGLTLAGTLAVGLLLLLAVLVVLLR